MPDSGRSEIYFMVAMMALILILSTVACIFFVRTYRKEMREKEERRQAKLKQQPDETPAGKEVTQ